MSVRSFHSVFMASAVAGAALGCYLVSLRVASERAALEDVESHIVQTQSDIRLLQTEIGTRGRLAQLERWNLRVLSLSAPAAGQILGDKFQLARLIRPEHKLEMDAPVVVASAPAPQPAQPLARDDDPDVTEAPAAGLLLHEASLKLPEREMASPAASAPAVPKSAVPRALALKATPDGKKVGDKKGPAASAPVTRPVRTAKADPLAPLPEIRATTKDSGRTQ
jgi:hypothetical protein